MFRVPQTPLLSDMDDAKLHLWQISRNPRWWQRPFWKLVIFVFYRDCIICFHVCYHNYTYIQYLTSQIAIMNFSNNMREKIIYISLIFWCQNVKNSDLFSKKIYYDYIEPFSQIDKVEFREHVCLEFLRPHHYQICMMPSSTFDK